MEKLPLGFGLSPYYRAPPTPTSTDKWLMSLGLTPSYIAILRAIPDSSIPPPVDLSVWDKGFFLGVPWLDEHRYIGIPQRPEEHIIVVGGSGSGKSSGIAKPTLRTWDGAICATDVKGELSESYEELYQNGFVTRPYIIFDPTDAEGPSYDPFDWLLQDDEANLVNNVLDIVRAIHPVLRKDEQQFWTKTEQGVFAAALLHYFKCGLSFSETITEIVSRPVSALCENLLMIPDKHTQFFLGEITKMKPETLANIDRGLRNRLMLFAADPYISHAFRGKREGAVCFTWEDLNTHNIFLRIPADKIEQWGGAINLMYSQLIRHFERRPEKYSSEGTSNVQTLLLMDEFARFGKLGMITAALATLRSKNVNICLMIQSVAQLDRIYGEYERRVIFDNCQCKVILRADDADTQKYLCQLIGTCTHLQHGTSEHMDENREITGYSSQISEIRDSTVQPHELSTLSDVLLLTPYGFCRARKFRPYNDEIKSIFGTATNPATVFPNIPKKNEGATIMSIEERCANAKKCIDPVEHQQKVKQKKEEKVQKKKDQRRNYIIGELVARYFPAVLEYDPGTDDENRTRFAPLEAFLYMLSIDTDLVDDLRDRATQLMSENPDGEWRVLT